MSKTKKDLNSYFKNISCRILVNKNI